MRRGGFQMQTMMRRCEVRGAVSSFIYGSVGRCMQKPQCIYCRRVFPPLRTDRSMTISRPTVLRIRVQYLKCI